MNLRDDAVLDALLRNLTSPTPNAARAAGTRARCVERLTRPSWHERLAGVRAPASRRMIEPAVAALAATLFLGDVIVRALRLYGIVGD